MVDKRVLVNLSRHLRKQNFFFPNVSIKSELDYTMKSSRNLPVGFLGLFLLNCHVCAQVTFAPATNYTVGLWPDSVMAVDANADGKVDLVCRNSGNFSLSVLTNTGSGDFVLGSSPSIDGGVSWIKAADINGDGKVDLVCESYYEINALSLMTNDGSGEFALSFKIDMPYEADLFMAADMNGDNSGPSQV